MATIHVIYHSDTGNTQKLAELVAEGARSVEGTDVKLVKASEIDYDAAAKAAALAIGSPDYFSYVAGQVKTFFDKTLRDERFKDKPYVSFGTHGGGAKVLDCIDKLAKAVKLRMVAPGVLTKGAPDAAGAEKARQLGRSLAEAAR
ncbi:MAG TPA: flavodoxin domain-containing protein [Phycisphaerae bacterium]|nr:flavodoxin domain-containing protein [Phycisphaerae bacterium]HUT60924.1 flavodoxin domain-containing protein [Phycisphaerae bacterium]